MERRRQERREKKNFEDFYLSDEVLEALDDIDYDEPTEVQREAIPLILAGIDLIVQSQTGTGKTAACAIPIIEMLDPQPGRIEVLVMAPTRELAKQVCREFDDIGATKGINATAIYGGTPYEKQYKALETAQVVAATPGRLLDLLNRGKINLEQLRVFGLDEADEMLSMGFREELEAIVEYLPEERQSLLFSATVTEAIKSLAKGMLFYPEYITLSSDSVAAESVTHEFYRVDGRRKGRDLVRILQYLDPESAIVFANTRADTFEVTETLQKYGFDAEVLNGELPQSEREKTLGKLREGTLDFLVATDVAARGIDISDLGTVINYALPRDPEVYVHRTGRTGRIGKKGRAVSIVSPEDMASLMEIERLYDIDIRKREFPSDEEVVESREKRAIVDFERQIRELEHIPYGGKLGMAERLFDGDVDGVDRERLAARLLAIGDAVVSDRALRDQLTGLPAAFFDGDAPKKRRRRPPEAETTSRASHQRTTPEPDEAISDEEPSKTRERSEPADTQQADSADSPEASQTHDAGSNEPAEPDHSGDDQEDDLFTASDSAPDYPMSKMYMDIGHDHFDDSDELREMICYMSGMVEEDFGEIVLKSHYSFVEVREDYFYDIINALNNETYEDKTLTAEPARS